MNDMPPRQRDAITLLAEHPERSWTPAGFAAAFWPGKTWARSNGPWGLGSDASGRHGGRMLTALKRRGLVADHDYCGGSTWKITLLGIGSQPGWPKSHRKPSPGRTRMADHNPLPNHLHEYITMLADLVGKETSASNAIYMEVPGLVQLYVSLQAAATDVDHPCHDYFRERDLVVHGRIARDIERRQASGTFDPTVDAKMIARMLLALSDGLQAEWAVNPEIDLAGTLDAFWNQYARPAGDAE